MSSNQTDYVFSVVISVVTDRFSSANLDIFEAFAVFDCALRGPFYEPLVQMGTSDNACPSVTVIKFFLKQACALLNEFYDSLKDAE